MTTKEEITFTELVELLENIQQHNKRIDKILILRDFIKKCFNQEVGFILDLISGNFQREIGKRNINISLKTILDAISTSYNVNSKELNRDFNKLGDIGRVALASFKNKKTLTDITITINDIKTSLIKMSTISGTNSNKTKKEIISKLFFGCQSPSEAMYLAKILIGDLRIGTAEGVIKEALANAIFANIKDINLLCNHCNKINLTNDICFYCKNKIDSQDNVFKNYNYNEYTKKNDLISQEFLLGGREIYNLKLEFIEKKYNIVNSFSKIITDFIENKNTIFEQEIIIGTPLKSMLGINYKTTTEANEKMKKPFLADYKYDGLRLQIHKTKNFVKIFSRNLEDTTEKFPDIVEFFKNNFLDESFIIDSEGVGYDFENQKFIPFQDFSSRFQSKNFDKVKHIKVAIRTFDILYLNGETLLDKPYKERRKLLESLFLNRDLKQKLHFNVEKLK